MVIYIILLTALSILFFWVWRHLIKTNREIFIQNFIFPIKIRNTLQVRYPHLTDIQLLEIEKGLRHFFLFASQADKKMISMPSQVVDVAWHEFILFTRLYQQFCRKAFGRFLHHTPAEAMHAPQTAQEGIRLAWNLACKHENINPKKPERLPLLFAIDSVLHIADGYHYTLYCTPAGNSYCASHISCNTGCGGGSGCSSCGGDSSSGSACGGD